MENSHQSSIFLVLHYLPVFHHLPRNLSNFIWDSSKGATFVSHHNGKVGIEVRNFFDCYESMETTVTASTVSQEILTKYHEAVEVASEALLSDITPDQLAVACKELNAKENKDQSLVIYSISTLILHQPY